MRNSLLAGENTLYFEYLMGLVGGEEWWDDYTESLIRLFFRRYYYENELDSASAMYGKNLRAEAIIDGVPSVAVLHGEPTVLEVLVSLALRVDQNLLYNEELQSNAPKYFDDILEVLGMKVGEDYIDSAIDRFLAGKSQITRKRRVRPFETTLWEQVNMFYYDTFRLESDF